MIATLSIADDHWYGVEGLEAAITAAAAAITAADQHVPADAETAVLLTGDDEIRVLNKTWRGRDVATNVLSFPVPTAYVSPQGEPAFLGDVALAWGVVSREAEQQGKSVRDHACHLVIHGMLHLLGYDHDNDTAAGRMEALEARILAGLGIPDPYRAAGMI